MGNLVKTDIAANKYALDALDNHVNIQLANTDWAAETQARFLQQQTAQLQPCKEVEWRTFW